MASDFNARNDSNPSSPVHSPSIMNQGKSKSPDPMDNLKRDRFELLSAYLDGEVTPEERREVEGWLRDDPSVQCLYARLLKLRQGLRSLPTAPPERPVEQTVNQVLTRVNTRPRLLLTWGGAAAAAVVLGVLSYLGPINTTAVHRVAESSVDPSVTSESVESEALILALDRPILEIPKAPNSPQSTTQPSFADLNTTIR